MAKAGRIYVNQSVSFPPDLLRRARERAERLGLRFSTYVQKCVEADVARGGPIEFVERDREAAPAIAAEKAGSYESQASPRRKGKRKT